MEALSDITVSKLKEIILEHSPERLTHASLKTRSLMLEKIATFPPNVVEAITSAARTVIMAGQGRYANYGTRRKAADYVCGMRRKRIRRQPPKVAREDPQPTAAERLNFYEVSDERLQEIIEGDFLMPPSIDLCKERLAKFIDASSNEALRHRVCASCAREMLEEEMNVLKLSDIPHRHLLNPYTPHPAHVLTEGMLLHTGSLLDGNNAILCSECLSSLKKCKRPKFSLGNNMWVGDVPRELADLTLPEKMLIAMYFPAAYIIKLFPKQKGAQHWDRSQMHSGLRGNVSTYKLDPNQVASMLKGGKNVFPRPSKILPATIGVTFVGPKGLPESTMPAMFKVRRKRVHAALVWLKANNPLYENIDISDENLQMLPEDGIPLELLATTKYSSDLQAVEKEHAGYVPEDAAEEEAFQDALNEAGLTEIDEHDNSHVEEGEVLPSVIPLLSHGVVDVQGGDITTSELLAHALNNMCTGTDTSHQVPEDFTVRRGNTFVNEYPRRNQQNGRLHHGGPSNPNHLLGSFPALFPYGAGGIETDRPVQVPYETHVRWTMEYHDHRFRKDPHYPFQVFGVMQKREVCRSAVLQMKKSTFMRNMRLISTLKPRDLLQASQEEKRGITFTNPAVRALRTELRAVRKAVKGTDESRSSVRSKVWGTNLLFNPPSIWMTINPADTQDPIAQVFAGEEIDLDAFCNTAGPDHTRRATNMASDPYASAQYFHFIVKLVLEELLGIKKYPQGRLEREYGVLGKVQCYIGTVEAQGRGTLHLHTLIWLKDAPNADEMKRALLSERFREKMRRYIETVIQADIGGKTKEQVLAIPKVAGVGYSRPVDPRHATDQELLEQLEKLVRAMQYHKCTAAACLKLINGRMQCKRRAPFEKAVHAWVDEVGRWGPKRLCELLNAFNPWIMHALRANHDLKLILSGMDTATITFYITNYATKKQQRTSNLSALLANAFAFSKAADRGVTDMQLVNKRLIQRCANSLTRYREFSGPEIVSYIMGWGDVYESHHYIPIFWDPVARTLKKMYPELCKPRTIPPQQSHEEKSPPTTVEPDGTTSDDREGSGGSTQEQAHDVTLEMVDGRAMIKDQLRDYVYRGEELEHMSFLDFMLFTYEGDLGKKGGPRPEHEGDAGHEGVENGSINVESTGGLDMEEQGDGVARGRPMSQRVPYKEGAGKASRCRIIRGPGHERLPRFVGRWFPRNDCMEDHEKEFYFASMVALLSPWTELQSLKGECATFEARFQQLLGEGKRRVHTVIHNIQYYYECLDGAHARREMEKNQGTRDQPVECELDFENEEKEMLEEEMRADPFFDELTEEDVEIARMGKIPARETLFAAAALYEGERVGFFEEECPDTVWRAGCRVARGEEEIDRIAAWDQQLKETVRVTNAMDASCDNMTSDEREPRVLGSINHLPPHVERLMDESYAHFDMQTDSGRPVRGIERRLLAYLNEEQRRAHDIVERKLVEHLTTHGHAKQLLMLILGQGGVGKSMLIGAITETFDFYGQLNILAKCATTGIAATDIGGQTLHSWAGLSKNTPQTDEWLEKPSAEMLAKRKRNIEGKSFLILDEASMADKTALQLTSAVTGHVHGKARGANADLPFGGMHVILTGDFHQFPPVRKPQGALYVESEKDSVRAMLGREIFKQFETVVILDKQIRVKDVQWMEILNRLRVGECDYDDIDEIEKLVLEDQRCVVPDFTQPPWDDAILVTPRHVVREMWNQAAIKKHCHRSGNIRYIVEAEDTVKSTGERASIAQRCEIAAMKEDLTGNLTDVIEIAVGMKAMIKINIATEADIANGTRGIIHDIILDEREGRHPVIENGVAKLKYPPAMLLFKPNKPTHLRFEGIEPGLIPLTPSEAKISVKLEGEKKATTIMRRQYAITAGYAFTDYKSQGQTIEYVIIDLAPPPSGSLSPFGAYVALSRSRGRDTIRLLRKFDHKLFQHHPSEDLRADMKRLEELNKQTKVRWEFDQQQRIGLY